MVFPSFPSPLIVKRKAYFSYFMILNETYIPLTGKDVMKKSGFPRLDALFIDAEGADHRIVRKFLKNGLTHPILINSYF